MSERITQELRGLMEKGYTFVDFTGNVARQDLFVEQSAFEMLCDSIDSIHANLERENDRLKCELDRVLGELDEMHKTDGLSDNSGGFMQNAEHHAWTPESHYMMLPKDADGEPIHAGDVLDGYGKTIEVVELRYGRSGWVLISRDGNGYADTFAFTHHHEPSVEDVLYESLKHFGAVEERTPEVEEWLHEQAAKLRLAEGVDE